MLAKTAGNSMGAAAQAPQLDVNPREVGGAEAPATARWVLEQHDAVHFADSGREGVEVIELCRNHENVRIVLAEGNQRYRKPLCDDQRGAIGLSRRRPGRPQSLAAFRRRRPCIL